MGNQNTPDRKTSSLLVLKIKQVAVKDAYCEPQWRFFLGGCVL